MKVEGYLFGFLALFFIPVTVVYYSLSGTRRAPRRWS